VGWRFVNERRAVNLDPNCGWARGKADVLYVADAFAVMMKLNALLAEKQPTAIATEPQLA
jgi:electron transfer flavoprotein alpha subunit